MVRSNRSRVSSHGRRLRPALVLAFTLLVPGSIAAAPTVGAARLIDSLRRDLGALHAQLEQIVPWHNDTRRPTVAFNADLGDGGPAFHRLSLVTIVHAAVRDFERLIAAYRAAGDESRAHGVEALRFRMYGLTERIDQLSVASGPATTIALRDETEARLVEFDQVLGRLIAGLPAAAAPVDAEAEPESGSAAGSLPRR